MPSGRLSLGVRVVDACISCDGGLCIDDADEGDQRQYIVDPIQVCWLCLSVR